jgi:hypothetical protein
MVHNSLKLSRSRTRRHIIEVHLSEMDEQTERNGPVRIFKSNSVSDAV